MSEFQSPQKHALATAMPENVGKSMAPPPFQLKSHPAKPTAAAPADQDALSARFEGEDGMQSIFAGTTTLKTGDTGMNVVKLQTALLDMGYALPLHQVDGSFGPETKKALKQFQKDTGIAESGKLDAATIEAIDKRLDTRQDYIQAGTSFDPAKPENGTMPLKSYQQEAVLKAMDGKPPGSPGKAFDPKDSAAYAQEIADALKVAIPAFHKTEFEDKKPLRNDPAKNFHSESTLENAANVARDRVDDVYGGIAQQKAFSFADGNLGDYWVRRESFVQADMKWQDSSKEIVMKFVVDDCIEINTKYSANPYGVEEAKALDAVVMSYVDTAEKVKYMQEIKQAWPGGEFDNKEFIQMYKDTDDEKNRLKMWHLYYTSIHEYIHALADDAYDTWAKALPPARKNTMVEGFADFFAQNVHAQFPPASLKAFQEQVEGPYWNASKDIPAITDLEGIGIYTGAADAERIVGIVGIHNAQLAYFKGKIELMGG